MIDRKCHECDSSIHACMGFVNCTDFLKLAYNRNHKHVRELCGKCVLLKDMDEINRLIDEYTILCAGCGNEFFTINQESLCPECSQQFNGDVSWNSTPKE